MLKRDQAAEGRAWLFLTALAAILGAATAAQAADRPGPVTLLKTPAGGIQPQAAVDAEGTIHLVYFKGEAHGGDLEYTSRKAGADEFAAPIRVNSQPRTAVAAGTIRGGQLALGRKGRVHVVWNGAMNQAATGATHEGAALFYTRSDTARSAFEPQRDLIRHTSALDGGGTVAADSDGNVYAAWHGRAQDAPEGEGGRTFWITRSTDDGATFAPEELAQTRPTGACGCCGTRALAGPDGSLYLLYRAATRGVERDMMLLASHDRGLHFEGRSLQPWPVKACPMSSESFAAAPGGDVFAAWETQGQVSFARVTRPADPVSPPGRAGDRKHPAVAVNPKGEVLLAWAEGTGWQKGGHLAWQVFDATGRPTDEKGRVRNGIPVWGLPTAVARPDGGFVIIH